MAEKKSKVFNGKRYFLWNSSWRKGILTREANSLKKKGLNARVITVEDKYAPKNKSYELYVYGSLRDLVVRGGKGVEK